MKLKIRSRRNVLSDIVGIVFGASGLVSFATIALSGEMETKAAAPAVVEQAPVSFVSDGSIVKFDLNRASIAPIKGWMVEPKTSGVSLVMKEVLKPEPAKTKDYSQPLFARNITVMAINEASPIDEQRAESFKEGFLKMAQQNGSMRDLQFTSQKFFNFKGESDGLVFFTQHTSNGFAMMQMHVLVSGESKQYLVTYTDLANRFANPETYDQAWKTLSSIDVQGIAPKRYAREIQAGGMIFGAMMLLVLPFGFARFMSQRRIRKLAASLQDEWDTGKVSGEAEFGSNVSMLDTTRVGSLSSAGSSFLSTHKSRFATSV